MAAPTDAQFAQQLKIGAAIATANGKVDGLLHAIDIVKANPGAGTRQLCRLLLAEADLIQKGQETTNAG